MTYSRSLLLPASGSTRPKPTPSPTPPKRLINLLILLTRPSTPLSARRHHQPVPTAGSGLPYYSAKSLVSGYIDAVLVHTLRLNPWRASLRSSPTSNLEPGIHPFYKYKQAVLSLIFSLFFSSDDNLHSCSATYTAAFACTRGPDPTWRPFPLQSTCPPRRPLHPVYNARLLGTEGNDKRQELHPSCGALVVTC